jgi:hypothetical protein
MTDYILSRSVIVSNVHLDMELWKPDSFVGEFGKEKNDLVPPTFTLGSVRISDV